LRIDSKSRAELFGGKLTDVGRDQGHKISHQEALKNSEDIKYLDISDLEQSREEEVSEIENDQVFPTFNTRYLLESLSIRQVATMTPMAAPKGTSPKQGPTPVSLPINAPN
jgi:hypothetical protein